MEKIITRFPPSPTGYLHIGGARTALFNWLYARHRKGKFILRIEDTDTARSTRESVDAIFESLEWLGIDWDEGPFFQSRRFDIYTEYIQKLLDSGFAYYCTCSPEKLEEMRKKAMEVGGKPKYDGTCREKGLGRTDNAVIRFKAPISGTTVLEDVIKGNIVFQNEELDDFIIARSDGSPTYNFVVVVDDITMRINTVLRGDDHVMNTPKQILLYNALNSPLPTFGHVPMVLGSDRTRLSKRHGAMSVTAYRDMGYLPDAFINYLVRLGWSYGDQEFFSRDELIEKFSLENIGRSAGIFNPEKLLALNADHIKATPPDELIKYLSPFLKEKGYSFHRGLFIENVVRTLNARSKTLKDMADDAGFYFTDSISYDEKAAKKFFKPASLEPLVFLAEQLEALDEFNETDLENAFKAVMEKTGLKLGKIAQPVRLALTGRTASPGIFEIIEIIGKDRVLSRIKDAIKFVKDRGPIG
ncbi:MAG: glutamate--tRNA ligase [Desulfobacterales bacterium]|nr:glutamate--tRNA ligase [Desulfobacterales bacterium]MDX2509355.1 glutamate--tRNA ligase [Desulfobacterales bacterium]